LDLLALGGGQHHEAHDGGGANLDAVAGGCDLGVELARRADELGRGAGMESALVPDRQAPFQDRLAVCRPFAHSLSPARTRDAILMYFRPASWAAATASSRLAWLRTLASLISMGRLMPAITSTLALPMTDMARLDGVPPNMSVRMMTPEPSLTALTASTMSLRRCSMSSSGPIHMDFTASWGPTTCSVAAMNSPARRPWVTRTIPIIENLQEPHQWARARGRAPDAAH